MARISGVDLPREKRVEIGLTYIFGIGHTTAKQIVRETGISPETRVRNLTEEEVVRLREYIDKNLPAEVTLDLEILVDELSEAYDFLLREVAYSRVRIDSGLAKDALDGADEHPV